MRMLRDWLMVALAAAATFYGAYLALDRRQAAAVPRWEGSYVDLLYLDLFALIGQWVTVGILAFLTLLGTILLLRSREQPTKVIIPPVKPLAELPPPPALSPPREPAPVGRAFSQDRIARIVGGSPGMPPGLQTLPPGEPQILPPGELRTRPAGEVQTRPPAERSPAERMLAEALAKIKRERAVVTEAHAGRHPSLRLVPQVPVRGAANAVAWLGGGARLPDGVDWPEIDGEALQFLAQLDCAQLPAELWGGIGPRQGWLAMFLAPRSLKAQVIHFSEAGPFRPAPEVLENSSMVHPDLWRSESALRPPAVPAFPRWPVELVVVEQGQEEPRRSGRGQIIGRLDHFDIMEPRFQPFDWPSLQMMMQLALNGHDRALRSPEHLPEPDGAALLEKLKDLGAAVDIMSATLPFTHELAGAVLAEARVLPAFQPRKPSRLNGKNAASPEVSGEPVPSFARAAMPAVHETTGWQVPYVRYLQDRAKHIHSGETAELPAPLLAHCEEVWRGWAMHEMGAIGHLPWGKLRNFEEKDEVLLLELPSSRLLNWHFGNATNLVLTIRKEDLALGDFDRVSAEITG